jgi:hypothetical protein
MAFSRSGYAGTRPILGKLGGAGFRLQKRRGYRNSFAPFFFGRFVASDRGTLIEGEFRMHPWAKVFMTGWFSFLVVFSVAFLISRRSGSQSSLIIDLGVPIMMAVFGVLLVKFGRWLGRGEERDIIEFLKSTLATDEAP